MDRDDLVRWDAGAPRGLDPGLLIAGALLVAGSCAALSVDVVRAGFGVKGDEATYVAMALSAAYDGDLAYEARDVERFYRIYNGGPEGIFLKRGSHASYRFDGSFPFIRRETRPDTHPGRLYFGKAYVYSVAAAPFVRLAGLNGLLLLHVALLSGVVLLGYRFLAARSPRGLAALYVLGFFGASIVPLYVVSLSPEIFNVACVFTAYFLWFYKEVAPPAATRLGRWVRSPWSDLAAAALLGVATYSKPTHLPLILPPLALALARRRFLHGFVTAAVFGGVAAAAFGVNAAVTGEFNYQGGDRRTFYGRFPFERPEYRFEQLGAARTTNEIVVDERPGSAAFFRLLGANLVYFLVGRHFGFLPFFFPGIVTVLLFLRPAAARRTWQWATLGTVALCAVALVVYMPYTWSGGGGPSGNRYFLSTYPLLLFVAPPLASAAPAAVAWLGGALFTAHFLVNPFVSAKRPFLNAERGALRLLPVEMTMVTDLPIMLDPRRSHVRYGDDPPLVLYFLDHNAHLPETPGIWIGGGARAELIVRSYESLSELRVTLQAPVDNTVTVELDGASQTVELVRRQPREVTFRPRGFHARRSWAYLLAVRTAGGFVPRLADPRSRDRRYLGVAIRLDATAAAAGGQAAGFR